jgi:hypothetical protein
MMYLHLRQRREKAIFGGVIAEVRLEGTVPSLGTENSRGTDSPFAVFQIDEFEGLSAIDSDSFEAEMFQRYSPEQLMAMAGKHLTTDNLIALLRERTIR